MLYINSRDGSVYPHIFLRQASLYYPGHHKLLVQDPVPQLPQDLGLHIHIVFGHIFYNAFKAYYSYKL